MYVVYKNGAEFLQTPCYQTACKSARLDAINSPANHYSIRLGSGDVQNPCDSHLYQIHKGMNYTIPRPAIAA
ncbi:MAG: hypothetical protein BWK73_32895 [Thiothrix lacustris]|uniref:Uncharacterized protein n=1 Tax=Thiothrix lacustris TaxID=525917 RepID=A0A1Y1QHF7_9GAMM|nr:MAG: hypothetical protein BWK73_32895 [Thiothrix lacustris]